MRVSDNDYLCCRWLCGTADDAGDNGYARSRTTMRRGPDQPALAAQSQHNERAFATHATDLAQTLLKEQETQRLQTTIKYVSLPLLVLSVCVCVLI